MEAQEEQVEAQQDTEPSVGDRLPDGRKVGACDYCGDKGIFPRRVRSLNDGRVKTIQLPGDLTKLSNGLVRCDGCEVDHLVRDAKRRGQNEAR